ncbi:MAG: hypothetical protein R6X18_17955 [Chloroflexota bacterium]|jgi:hypothetical protein
MPEPITVTSTRTEELDDAMRAAIIHVCRTAHQEDDFQHLFSYIPAGGLHVLAYREEELVGHMVATARRLQPEGLPVLRKAYVDAVDSITCFDQGNMIGTQLLEELNHEKSNCE